MTRETIEVNSDHIRGQRVSCRDCKDEKDSVLWKTLFLATRDPGRQLSKHDKRMVEIAADYHEEQHPDHHIVIFILKKLAPWGWFK